MTGTDEANEGTTEASDGSTDGDPPDEAATTADEAATDADVDPTEPDAKCDYCRLSIPGEPVTDRYEGVTYHFCSDPCRETLLAEGRVFTEYHAGRRFDPGVSALRAGLPQGIPRNSFVLISGQPGTRDEALHGELIWRALQRGEPAVVATFLDTPVSVVQTFVALGWNVLPYLASGQLRILDCFTYRLDEPEEMERSMSDWNRHLHRVAKGATVAVRDPSNPQAVLNVLGNCLDEAVDGGEEEGVAVIDSLTEFGSLVQPVQAYDFVKDLRASICKARTIPVFAGASRINEGTDFPHDLGYIADGVIDLTLSDELVRDTLMKRIRVRKMNGVLAIRRWATYEFTESEGLVAAKREPDEDDEASDAEADADDESAREHPTESPKTDDDVAPAGDAKEASE